MRGSLQTKVYGTRQGATMAKRMGSHNGSGKRMGSYNGSVKRLGIYTGVGGAKSNIVSEMYPHY